MYSLLKALVLPPASIILALLLGQMWSRRSVTARRFVFALLIALYALATPLLSSRLLGVLEVYPSLPAFGPLIDPTVQAIVILSAEARVETEFGHLSPGPMTLERLRYGAALQRRTGLPILVTGGREIGQTDSLANAMRTSLVDDFRVPVTWSEDQSQDTHQNAQFSARILKDNGISKIYLVTHAWHMARAKLIFERMGLSVVAAPTAFASDEPPRRTSLAEFLPDIIPTAKALHDSYFAIHELSGYLFYCLAYHT
jgi:uncharacterized SAM-binding protein YcdF (DUF218 family)